MPFGPEPETGRETKWRFRLEREDGTPADPPTPRRPSPRGAGDAIPLGRERNARGSRRPARAGGSALNRLGASALFLRHGDPLRLPELVNHEVVIPANHDLFHLRVFVFDRDY